MLTLKRTARRGIAAGVAGLLVAGTAAVLAAPAQAETAHGLTWNVSAQWQTHLGQQTPSGGATFDTENKEVTFPLASVDVGEDGSTTANFEGTINGAFGFGGNTLYSITISEPTVVVDADGDGAIRATVSSTGTRTNPTLPFPAEGPATVTVAEFSGATTTDGVLTATPNWEGVLPADSALATELDVAAGFPVEGRSFHPDFLASVHPDVRSTFYWSGVSEESNLRKAPGVISASLPEAEVAPSVATSVASASYEDGIQVKVEGEGFDAGDVGIYALLAPADTEIDPSDRDGMSAFPTVYVMPQDFDGDSFVTVISEDTEDLVKGTEYAVFTLRAHGLPDRSQDTKTPVDIDWSQLEAPAAKKVKTTTKITKTKHAKKAAKFKQIRVRAKVGNPAKGKTKGKVQIIIKKGKKNVRVVKGVKLNKNGKINRVVKGLGKKVNKKGQYRVVVKYTGTKKYAKSKAVKKFRLK